MDYFVGKSLVFLTLLDWYILLIDSYGLKKEGEVHFFQDKMMNYI